MSCTGRALATETQSRHRTTTATGSHRYTCCTHPPTSAAARCAGYLGWRLATRCPGLSRRKSRRSRSVGPSSWRSRPRRKDSVPPTTAEAARNVRTSPLPTYGGGLVEAISDSTIIALEDPDDRDGDGISGRAARVVDRVTGKERVGRFGWKAQVATLFEFGAEAYRSEMGITNDLFPDELTFGIDDARLRDCDPIGDPEDETDPETGRRGIDNVASFMRFLAPIAREPHTPASLSGEEVFTAAGCASCHVPTLTTGRHLNPIFDRQPVPLYSDLLLHDIGTGDGIPQAAGGPDEFRTPALWGLRFRRPLLHDGRAATLSDALLAHGGEARSTMDRLVVMPATAWSDLLAFLRSL